MRTDKEQELDQILEDRKQSKRKSKRSGTNAETVKGALQGKLNDATRAVADATKAQILAGGLSLAFSEMAQGDFGDVSESVLAELDDFIEGMNAGVHAIEAAESDPKYLPPASPLLFRPFEEEVVA